MVAHHHDRVPILNRLARAEGHFRSVRTMLEDDRPCPEVLLQLAAIRAAIDKIARLVLEDHLDACILNAVMTGDAEAEIAALKTALARYVTG